MMDAVGPTGQKQTPN